MANLQEADGVFSEVDQIASENVPGGKSVNAALGLGSESTLPSQATEDSAYVPCIKGFELPQAPPIIVSPPEHGNKVPNVEQSSSAGNRLSSPDKGMGSLSVVPPACVAGLTTLDLSSGSPRPAHRSGSSSHGKLTPVPESGGGKGPSSLGGGLRKLELFSNGSHGSSSTGSPISRHASRTIPASKLSQDDFHSRVVMGLQGELGPHHSRHNSGSIKVSSALDDVVPALERIIAEASLTPEQRKDLQFSLQVILSRTLYEPTVKSPSTPPSPRSNRRSTLNLVSPKLELDEETQKWLAHEYRLDQYTIPDKYSLSMSLPSAFSNQLNKTGSSISRSFTFGRLSPGMSPLASPGRRRRMDESPLDGTSHAQMSEFPVEKALIETETAKVLTKLHDLDFDVFELAAVNKGAALKVLATAIFTELDLCKKLGIYKETMDAFLTSIEAGYRQVPYHNNCHAADVLHAAYLLITRGFLEEWMTDQEIFSILVAAIIHDFRHPGISNAFLIASRDPLATLYNDRAVLENHHLASAFVEMYKSGQNILGHFSMEQQKAIRSRIVQLVLVTDMSEHFEFAGRFKTRVLGPGFNLDKDENRLCIMQMVLKCADLNSAAKPQKLAVDWAGRIMMEFFNQGDKEKQLGLPVSPMCDKEAANVPKQQLRFIEFIVQPLYEIFAEHCPALDDWLQGLEANKVYWQGQMKEEPQLHPDIKIRRTNSRG